MSCLIHRFLYKEWQDKLISTIGVAYYKSSIVDSSGNKVDIELWDSTGQQTFTSIIMHYLRVKKFDAVMIGYDITCESSFDIAEFWVRHLQSDEFKSSANDPFIMLVGCKSDLEERRRVPVARVVAFAETHGLPSMLASANTGHNVEAVFTAAAVGGMSKQNPGSTE